MNDLGLEVFNYTPHTLRHTFATNLVSNDVAITDVSKALEHSSPLVAANVYLHSEQKKIRDGLLRTI